MKGLFKTFGKGILFIVILPFWIIAFSLFLLYAIVVFFITLFSAIPAYFRGESVFSPDEIDIAASKKLAEQKQQAQAPPPAPVVQPQTTIILNAVPMKTEEAPIEYIENEAAPLQQITAKDFHESLPEADVVTKEEEK